MLDTNSTLIISGIATTIIVNLIQLYKDARNRKWDLQDRIEKAERESSARLADAAGVARALKIESERVAIEVKMQANTLALAGKAQAETVLARIQENTDISASAFDVANRVNEKLLKIHERIDQVDKSHEK
jgi:hypothetical protein